MAVRLRLGKRDFDGGRFQLFRLLAEGGQAEVWSARNNYLGMDCVLKIARTPRTPEEKRASDRLRQEAMAGVRLPSHPNLVRVLNGARTAEGQAYVVLERLHGATLEQHLENGPLPLVDGLQIGIAVADALALVHRCGLLHRDIKPGNIFIEDDGVPKLLDFGYAKMRRGPVRSSPHTTVGTPIYSCPHYLTTGEYDARSDQYSLAVTICETIMGRFSAPLAPWMRSREYQPILDIMARARARAPDDRYPTIAAFRDDLARGLASVAATAERALSLATSSTETPSCTMQASRIAARMRDFVTPPPRSMLSFRSLPPVELDSELWSKLLGGAGKVAMFGSIMLASTVITWRVLAFPGEPLLMRPEAQAAPAMSFTMPPLPVPVVICVPPSAPTRVNPVASAASAAPPSPPPARRQPLIEYDELSEIDQADSPISVPRN